MVLFCNCFLYSDGERLAHYSADKDIDLSDLRKKTAEKTKATISNAKTSVIEATRITDFRQWPPFDEEKKTEVVCH
jgi:hypothetical protein